MKLSDLKPAGQLSVNYGVKAIVYGAAGSGKTPMINTAPNCVLLACEAGLLSMRGSNIPCAEGYTSEAIDDFLLWFFTSAESKKFDTLAIDSMSQLAEIILTHELKKVKDPRQAYGKLDERVMKIANDLYFAKQKNVVLLCKQALVEEGDLVRKKPYFPGQALNIKLPHMFDEIWHCALTPISGQPQPVTALRTREDYNIIARDRSGRLDQFEPPNLAHVFAKCLAT